MTILIIFKYGLLGTPMIFMRNSMQYPGSYSDSMGTVIIIVENDFKILSCEIDGVRFYGRELSDLSVDNRSKYTNQQLERFKFYPVSIYGTNEVELILCNCSFSLIVPQIVVDTNDNVELDVDIKIDCFLTKKEVNDRESESYKLSMTLNEQKYFGASEHIEDVLLQIQNQLGHKYFLKNCFGCMYGDYSVYGSCAFGSMICYSNQKEKYKQVTNKDEYMDLDTNNCQRVQEIYCCEDFELRKIGVGYRG